MKISLPPVIVADANVVLSALIGGRARLVIAFPHEPKCIATEAVAHEIARHVPRLAAKRDLDHALLLAALQVMPIEWKPASSYKGQRKEAEKRIADRDPDDWPTVALALELDLPSGPRTKTSRSPASRSSRPANCSTRCETPVTARSGAPIPRPSEGRHSPGLHWSGGPPRTTPPMLMWEECGKTALRVPLPSTSPQTKKPRICRAFR